MTPRKRTVDQELKILEPQLDSQLAGRFGRGVELFNAGEYWHAHEAWEDVWRTLNEDAEIVLRGLIQLAAGLHLLGAGRMDGARSNLTKALQKLSLAPPVFLGVDTQRLCVLLRAYLQDTQTFFRVTL